MGSPVLFAMIAIMIEPVGIGFAIGYALAFAPFIFLAFCVLGVILEGIYTFCTRKFCPNSKNLLFFVPEMDIFSSLLKGKIFFIS